MKIVFFNHKGGVSKTTTTFNIGWMLADRGHKVLLVDADPQCNLTSLIMQDDYVNFYSDPATMHNNLKDGVNPAFEGKPTPIGRIDCYQPSKNSNLYLLPGHPNLSELEPTLSFAQTAPGAFSTLQNLPGAFNALIENTSTHYGIEYVLIDLNPGLSPVNQNLFSISDAFIIPTNPDPFSIMAIDTLSTILPRWYKAAQEMHSSSAASSYPFPNVTPKLGGVFVQRFNVRNGKPARQFQNTMEEILAEVKSTLLPNLTRAGMVFNNNAYSAAKIDQDYCLAAIPDFQSLQQGSQEHGVPVFALTDAELNRVGTVLTQVQSKRADFKKLFEEVAEKIELLKANA